MSELKVMSEKPIGAFDLVNELKEIKKKSKELSPKAQKTLDYLNAMGFIDSKKAKGLWDKIVELNIPRLKERHIIKILEIMPEDMDSMKMVFSGENITIKQEDLNRILSLLK